MVGGAFSLVNATLGRRTLLWAAILAAFSVGLCFVPLFDVLGYDFSFALGIVVAFAASDVGEETATTLRSHAPPLVVYARAAGRALALLVLPLAAACANALRVRNCSVADGLIFFFLLPVCSALFAALAGALVGLVMARRARLVAWALPLGAIVWTLLRLYRDPAVFALDPFGGYFPGPIYDEAMAPPPRLFAYRGVNAVWIAAALACHFAGRAIRRARVDRGSRRGAAVRAGLALVLVLASAGLYAKRGALGFHVTRAHLAQALGARLETEHFVVHLDRAAVDEPRKRERLSRDLEFRYAQLTRILGVTPAGKVTIYLFPSPQVKKELVGAGATLYAKPWTREIFVHGDRVPLPRLRHELAHVFAGAFGDRLFGISLAWRFVGPIPLPRLASGLVEGIAEAADFGDPDGRSTVHQEARAIVADGRAPPLASVVGAGFTTLSGARAYTLAGSFTHFLLSTRGSDRLRALYGSAGDFEAVYGAPLSRLEAQWRAFLETQPLDARERAGANERFRRGAIFGRVCARDLAARLQEARARLWTAPEAAVTLLESVCRDDPREPLHRLELAEALAVSSRSAEALATAAALRGDEELTDPVRARAAALAASLHVYAGRDDDARAALEEALARATEDAELRSLAVKRRALADPVARRTLGRVMFGDAPNRGLDAALTIHLVEAFARAFPDEALGPYLLARQLAPRDPGLALPPLEEACPFDPGRARGKPLAPLFSKECERLTGETALLADELPRARRAYERLRDNAESEAERLRALDALDRITFLERTQTR